MITNRINSWYCKYSILSILMILLIHSYNVIAFLTKKESAHINVPYETPDIVKEFIKQKLFSESPDTEINEIMKHHQLAESFCINYMYEFYRHKCTYRDYHVLYDHIREPYVKLYDPVS